jgi:hypothetical protein
MAIFFPSRRVSFSSRLTPSETMERVRVITDEKRGQWLRLKKPGKIFYGTVDDRHFKISRIIYYRNSALPLIEGEVKEHSQSEEGSEVSLKLGLRRQAIVVTLLLLLGLAAVATSTFRTPDFDFWLPVFVFIPFFMYVITILGFAYEAQTGVKILKEKLEERRLV